MLMVVWAAPDTVVVAAVPGNGATVGASGVLHCPDICMTVTISAITRTIASPPAPKTALDERYQGMSSGSSEDPLRATGR